MSLAEELLEQSRFLASLDPHNPKQANLRRAVSSAYYAVFHLLAQEVAGRLTHSGPPGLLEKTVRAMNHGSMYRAAGVFSVPGPRPQSLPADIPLPEMISASLSSIATGFRLLQEQRHEADYNVSHAFDRLEVLGLVEIAENIFQDWDTEKTSPNASVFLASLMFWNLWNK